MVGIALGLLTIAVALGALMVSHGVTATVSDAAQLQQQAAYAMRTIGQQVRQAGAAKLNLATSRGDAAAILPEDPVGFVMSGYTGITDVVSGADKTPTLTVGVSNDTELRTTGAATVAESCLGNGSKLDASGNPAYALITSTFIFDPKKQELDCNDGLGSGAQAVIRNVADFQLRYLVQQPGARPHVDPPMVFRTNAAGVAGANGNWRNVYAVEVCMELVGDEIIDLPKNGQGPDSRYTDCSGRTALFNGRLHMVFRNTFQLRSQGMFATPAVAAAAS